MYCAAGSTNIVYTPRTPHWVYAGQFQIGPGHRSMLVRAGVSCSRDFDVDEQVDVKTTIPGSQDRTKNI